MSWIKIVHMGLILSWLFKPPTSGPKDNRKYTFYSLFLTHINRKAWTPILMHIPLVVQDTVTEYIITSIPMLNHSRSLLIHFSIFAPRVQGIWAFYMPLLRFLCDTESVCPHVCPHTSYYEPDLYVKNKVLWGSSLNLMFSRFLSSALKLKLCLKFWHHLLTSTALPDNLLMDHEGFAL